MKPMMFDQSQQQVLQVAAAPQHGPLLVYGGPGSGKTSLAVELALRHLGTGEDSARLLVLSPTRATSARLRHSIEISWAAQDAGPAAGSMSENPSKSFAAYAYWLLGEARRRGVLSFEARQPRLFSGAEQDGLIKQLLSPEPESGMEPIDWPASLKEAAPAAGFRKEIRELFDRAAEYGISPAAMAELGEQCGHPEWVSAAELYRRYRFELDEGSQADAFDPAGLIREACNILEENPDLLTRERQRLLRIIVDDLQEASPPVLRLLRLIGAGAHVVAFATPETAVQGFRGARPDKLRNWSAAPAVISAEHTLSTHTLDPDLELRIRTVEGHIVRRAGSGSMVPDPAQGLDGAQPRTLTLTGNHRLNPAVGRVFARIASRLAAQGPPELREQWLERARAPEENGSKGNAEAEDGAVAVALAPTEYLAEQHVLQGILEAHHRHGVPLDEIAVVARSGGQLKTLIRMLQANGVPVKQSMSDVVLHEELAVEPLLRVLKLVTSVGVSTIKLEDAVALLTSPYGESDSMLLRGLRQRMRQKERQRVSGQTDQNGDPVQPRTSDQLIADAVNDPADPVVKALAAEENIAFFATRLQRIAAMIQAGLTAHSASASPEELLWAVWDAAGVARRWSQAAQDTGFGAERADRNLDAVLALFQAAERFADQNPGAGTRAFVDHMESLELPMDTLAQTSGATGAVEAHTPASAAGLEFDTVILTGMQEGIWPNLTPRGQLLRAGELVDAVEGNTSREFTSPLVKRMHLLQDEYRLFAAAVSRAQRRILAVAVENDEEAPSLLVDLIVPPERQSRSQKPPRPMVAPQLIAVMRRSLEESFQQQIDKNIDDDAVPAAVQDQRAAAARALAVLSQADLPGAAPDTWWGLPELSTDQPLAGPDDEVRISPSTLQTAADDPLGWFTSAAGGVEAVDFSRMLGTLIHKIAEDHPDEINVKALHQALDEQWHTLGLEDGWEADRDRQRAETMLEKYAKYLDEEFRPSGRALVATELSAHAALDVHLPAHGNTDQAGTGARTVVLRGTIDRVEQTADGKLFVIDIKTGKNKPRRDDISTHAQLGAYQLLVSTGAVAQAVQDNNTHGEVAGEGLAGAALLHLGTGIAKTDIQVQDPLGDQTWPHELIAAAAKTMTGASFDAFHEPGGWGGCRIGPLCPLCETTKQVTQP